MQHACIIGHATSTVKHPSLAGWRLLVAQPLGADDREDGDPVLAIDRLGASRGGRVMLTSDGPAVRQMMGSNNSPVRWAVIGLLDEQQ